MLHQIGAGSLGPVFRSYDPGRDRLVAVKAFRLDLTPEQAHRLAGALQQLTEPHFHHATIAATLATGVQDSTAYLAQEYFAADSLDVVLRQPSRVSLPHALDLSKRLADAIDCAAAANLHHGVLHPRDVLVSADDVRITGLGVAAAVEQIGVRPPIRRPYTAPERIDGQPWGAPADIFALAAIVHELLFGRRIAGAGAEATTQLGELPGVERAALQEVFGTALAADPAARYSSAAAFATAIESVLAPAVTAAIARDSRAKRASPRTPRAVSAPPPTPHEPGLPFGSVDDTGEVPAANAPMARAIEWAPASADLWLKASDHADDLRIQPQSERWPDVDPIGGAPAVVISNPGADHSLLADDRSRSLSVDPPFADEPLMLLPSPTATASDDEPSGLPLDRVPETVGGRRSAMLPFALTLAVGMLVAFVAGYGLGTRDRAYSASSTSQRGAPAGAATPTPTTGREGTEAPVQEISGSTTRPAAPPSSHVPSGRPAVVPAPAKRASETPLRSTSRAQVVIRSRPSGARVVIDGTVRGETPLTVSELGAGPHYVRLTHAGYDAEERRISVSASSRPTTMTVALRRAARAPVAAATAYGSLSVASRPPGASVYLNDKPIGTTPLLLSRVPTGTQRIHLARDGYQRWSSSVRIAAGERSRVAASLERGIPR